MAINKDQSPADLLAADAKSGITDTQTTAQPELVQTAFLGSKSGKGVQDLLNIIKDPDRAAKPKKDLGVEDGPKSDVEKSAVQDADILKSTADDTVGPAQGIDFNFSTFNNDDDVFRMLDSFTKTKGTTPTTKVTQAETAANASTDIKKFLSLGKNWNDKNVMFSPSQVVGMKEMLVQSADVLKKVSQRIKDGDDSTATLFLFREQMTRHASLVKVFKTGRANIARALDAFKIPPGYKSNINDFEAMVVGELGGSRVARKQAEKILEFADDPEKLHALVENGFWKKRTDEFMEIYINGLLSSPRSQLRNIIGNFVYQAYSIPETAISAIYGSVERTVKKGVNYSTGVKYFDNPDSGVKFNEAYARIRSYGYSWRKAWSAAAESVSQPVSGTKLEHASFRKESISSASYGFNADSVSGKGIDFLGKVIRFPGTALVWGDEFFKTMAREAELAELGFRHQNDLIKSGVTDPDEIAEGVTNYLFTNKSTIDSVEDAAKYYTFQTDLGDVGNWIQKGQDFPVIRIFMPFVRTPINIAKAFMRRTPLSLAEGVLFPTSWGKRFRTDDIFRQKEMGKIALGSATIYTAAEFFESGRITGSPPRNMAERDLYLNTYKVQPYSFVFPGEDTDPTKPLFDTVTGQPNGTLSYVSYAGIEPFGSFLGVTATAMDIMNRSDDPNVRDAVGAAALSATYDYYKQLPFLQGIASIYKVLGLGYDAQDGASFNADVLIQQLAGSVIPYRTLVGGVESVDDPFKRAVGADFMEELDLEPILLNAEGLPEYDEFGAYKPNPYHLLPKDIDNPIYKSVKKFLKKLELVGNQLQMNIPIVSGSLPMKYDYDFKPMEVGHGVNSLASKTYNMISPLYYSVGSKVTEADADIMRLGVPGYKSGKQYYGIRFDDRNWAKLMKRAGEVVDNNGMTFKEARQDLYFENDYQSGTGRTGGVDDNRKLLLRNLRSEFIERAFAELRMEDPIFENIYQSVQNRQELLSQNMLGRN